MCCPSDFGFEELPLFILNLPIFVLAQCLIGTFMAKKKKTELLFRDTYIWMFYLWSMSRLIVKGLSFSMELFAGYGLKVRVIENKHVCLVSLVRECLFCVGFRISYTEVTRGYCFLFLFLIRMRIGWIAFFLYGIWPHAYE